MKAIIHGKIIGPAGLLTGQALLFDRDIAAVMPEEQLPAAVKVVFDAGGHYVSPGFLDMHVHGCCGFDAMDEEMAALAGISWGLLSAGVTAFLPTTMTMGRQRINQALAHIRTACETSPGAAVVGCHLEGPFISRQYAGAQNPADIVAPDAAWLEEAADIIKVITLAPELPGSNAVMARCRELGIVLAIGHSGADYDVAAAAIAAGVRQATHTFNALPPLHHRQPGALAALLEDERVSCELIADNIHVHPAMQRLLLRLKGLGRIILVSDAMRAAMLTDGRYELGGQPVEVKAGKAVLENGVIAGSVLTLNQAVKNFRDNTGLSMAEAVQTVTVNPARQLGLYGKRGSLSPGKRADITVLTEECQVQAVFVGGDLRYGGFNI